MHTYTYIGLDVSAQTRDQILKALLVFAIVHQLHLGHLHLLWQGLRKLWRLMLWQLWRLMLLL